LRRLCFSTKEREKNDDRNDKEKEWDKDRRGMEKKEKLLSDRLINGLEKRKEGKIVNEGNSKKKKKIIFPTIYTSHFV
jgi:hypothetical protein